MKWLIVILILLYTLPFVSAQEILSYNLSVELRDTTAHEDISIELFNQEYFPIKTFSYVLKGDVQDIEVLDADGKLEATVTEKDGSVIQSKFREPLRPNTSTWMMIRFDVINAVEKIGEEYVFSPVFSLPHGTKKFLLRVRLPEGMGLPRSVSRITRGTDVVPLPENVYSDGRATIFEWELHNGKGDFAVYIRYGKIRPDQRRVTYVIGFLLILVAVAYYFRWRMRKPEISYLEGDEGRVLGLIRSEEGILQKKIVESTGFSKAKVSMILSKLEKEGLIRKERYGLNNRLYIIKNDE